MTCIQSSGRVSGVVATNLFPSGQTEIRMSVGGIRMTPEGGDVLLSQDRCGISMSQNISGGPIAQNLSGLHMSQNINGVQMSQNLSGVQISQMSQMSQNAGSIRYFTSNSSNRGGNYQEAGTHCMPANHNQHRHSFQVVNETSHGDHRSYQPTTKHLLQSNPGFLVNEGGCGTHSIHGASGNPVFTQDLLGCHDLTKN